MPWSRRLYFALWAILVLIVVELLLVVLLSWSPSGGRVEPLEAGEVVEPLLLRTLEGEPLRIDYAEPGVETVLMVFSPDCPACRDNMEGWKRTVADHAGAARRFYYVSMASARRTRGYVARLELRAPVLIGGPEELRSLRIRLIPTTVAVGSGGGVRGSWIGAVPAEAF